MITPEMLNDESVEKATQAIHVPGLNNLNPCTDEIRAAITAYHNAEIEAGRGRTEERVFADEDRNRIDDVLILRLNARPSPSTDESSEGRD